MVQVEPGYFSDLVDLHLRSRQFYDGDSFFEHLEELLKSWTDVLRQLWGEDEEPDIDEEIDAFLDKKMSCSDPTTREVAAEMLRPILQKIWNFIYPLVGDLDLVVLDSPGAMVRSGAKYQIILSGQLFSESQQIFLEAALYHEIGHLILDHQDKDRDFEEKEANSLTLRWL